MTVDARGPRPRAFRLDEAGQVAPAARDEHPLPRPLATLDLQPDAFAGTDPLPPGEAAVELAQRRGMRGWFALGWGGLFASALGGLVSFGIGLWIDDLVERLFARAPALGWIGVALVVVLVLCLAALAGREAVGILRQSRVARLHAAIATAHADDDRDAARRRVHELTGLYARRTAMAPACSEVNRAATEIIDGRDLIDIAERALLQPLDATVTREIAAAAKRVSLVTAISPRAVIDLVFVVAQIVRLIRRIAELYSGRPGFLGFLKLAKSVGTHLAVTGGMAVGDSLLQQVVGHGLAAKLSARLGEGVLNGLLTTRVGLSAMAVCRPMPFAIAPQPGVKDVAPFLFVAGKDG